MNNSKTKAGIIQDYLAIFIYDFLFFYSFKIRRTVSPTAIEYEDFKSAHWEKGR